jgi:hypothetical protein
LTKHSFTISEISFRGVPRAQTVYNEFDSFGTYLGLSRLPEERNTSYKKRLLDVFTRRASATYIGLLNGITRELGLEYYRPITISKRESVSDDIQPVIEFVENKVYVYKDRSTKEIELELNRSRPGEEAYWLQDLISIINDESVYFTIALNEGFEPVSRTDCLINQSSAKLLNGFPLRQSHIQALPNSNIEIGSIVFNNRSSFIKEVASDNLILRAGDYHVDYTNGVIKSYSTPADNTTIRYLFHDDPFTPIASPVIIRNLQSELFKEEMFLETISKDGSTNKGVPSELGASLINELMSVYPSYWGE